MTPKEQAARQALNALEDAYENGFLTGITGLKTIDVLTALREALNHSGEADEMVVGWDRVKPEAIASDPLYQQGFVDGVEEGRNQVAEPAEQEPKCNQHPDAPHGFDRNASHNAGRYVCECEGWSPDDMAYRPSGLSMEQTEQEPDGIVWDASAPVVMDSSSPKNKNKEVAELRKQVAALKAVIDAWNNVEHDPVVWVDLEQWQSGEYDCFTSEKVAEYMTPLYAAPVRTKDLTDDEIVDVMNKIYGSMWTEQDRDFARAVIAADREKNK